jgi:hypothetical protein
MNSQEHQKQNRAKPFALSEKRRRFIKGSALVAPVILTLSSKSVFGAQAQCLSQLGSINASQPNPGSCVTGFSPGAWRNPGGMIGSLTTIAAWTQAGFSYGTLKPGQYPTKCKNYSGGSLFSSAFPGNSDSRPMRQILCEGKTEDKNSGKWHIIAAILNARLLSNYVLTPAQVLGLWNGTISLPPGYTDLKSFLDSTWT